MKVLSIPGRDVRGESGIHTVIRKYYEHAKAYDIEFVTDSDYFDVIAIHAGMGRPKQDMPVVTHLHGLYWTGDYYMPNWAYRSNEHIVNALRHSSVVTVPSEWVAETIRRDMRLNPAVLPHGIDYEEWDHDLEIAGHVVAYAKNRAGQDVCDPSFLVKFVPRFKDVHFVSTFAPDRDTRLPNLEVTGVIPHANMRKMVQSASVFVSTTKETWGVAMLEALASGTPVLSYAYGGALDLVEHGVNGYLAQPGNIDDLCAGLEYCMKYRDVLGSNAKMTARRFGWDKAMSILKEIYKMAADIEEPTVSIVVPAYNKSDTLKRTVASALSQTYPIDSVVIVNDGSTDATPEVGKVLALENDRVQYISQDNSGVAHARNRGIGSIDSKYVCCIDADDWIDPEFIDVCVEALESDRSLGLAYTGLQWHKGDGTGLSKWPSGYNFDAQLKKQNQVPTCCVFRRDLWKRLGGYRQRYAPDGAGAEDAEFWTRMGAYGFGGVQVTKAGLFHYSEGTGLVSGNREYREVDWLSWHPWAKDVTKSPFMSIATAKKASHDVYQYDEPLVSVVIPVGDDHQDYLIDALDSLEAQTFRNWEAIVVLDGYAVIPNNLPAAYPYVKFVTSPTSHGAGWARNRGVELSRAPFLLFLDADDWLLPDCLSQMLDNWDDSVTGEGVYSDYIGVANVDDLNALAPNLRKNVISYRGGVAVIRYNAAPYDKERAQRQPEDGLPYLWGNITTLIPKSWHNEIGGFDESMSSWEDVDYWWRMARADKSFRRVNHPLMVYRFSTGERRQIGLQDKSQLLLYLRNKYANKAGEQ